jgi:cation diffusion facilitator family transporter
MPHECVAAEPFALAIAVHLPYNLLSAVQPTATPMNTAAHSAVDRKALQLAMTLSLVIGVLMFVMKTGAYLLTGSAAILSDAAESVVHVVAVGFAFYSLRLSYKPADDSHLYGHAKISFFSAGFEGAMIILAALYIIYESIHKWIVGLQLENLGAGTLLTAAATVINGGLGGYLVWIGRQKRSIILEANGKHVLTDCWTSFGVLIALGLTWWTGWKPWDPIFGILMAANILVSGVGLARTSFAGLMDSAEQSAHRRLVEILDRETTRRDIIYHNLRHRNVGDAHWVEVHFLFPDGVLLRDAHRLATEIEQVVETSLEPRAHVTSHLECQADHDEVHPGRDHI